MRKYSLRPKRYIPFVLCLLVISALSACGGGSGSPSFPSENAQPDLIATGQYEFIYVRTLSPTGNDLYTLVVPVTNQGTASAESIQITVHSKGPGIEGDLEPLENNGYYSISAGETVQAQFQFIFEKQFFGEYTFTIMADASNAAYELDEFNNNLEFSRTF